MKSGEMLNYLPFMTGDIHTIVQMSSDFIIPWKITWEISLNSKYIYYGELLH